MLVVISHGSIKLVTESGTGRESLQLAAGEAARIEKGTPYFWINEGEHPATVLMISTPAWYPGQQRLVAP